jgi:hypothetical protein
MRMGKSGLAFFSSTYFAMMKSLHADAHDGLVCSGPSPVEEGHKGCCHGHCCSPSPLTGRRCLAEVDPAERRGRGCQAAASLPVYCCCGSGEQHLSSWSVFDSADLAAMSALPAQAGSTRVCCNARTSSQQVGWQIKVWQRSPSHQASYSTENMCMLLHAGTITVMRGR